jgi:hypothetical protein
MVALSGEVEAADGQFYRDPRWGPILGGQDGLLEIVKNYQIEEMLVASHRISVDNVGVLSMAWEGLGVGVSHASLRLA